MAALPWVQLAASQVRDADRDTRTRVNRWTPAALGSAVRRLKDGVPPDYRAAFITAYPSIRSAAAKFDRHGVGIFAVDLTSNRYLGAMCLAARTGEVTAGVIGRHSRCQLLLTHDESLALRHVMCVVEPPTIAEEIRGRLRYRLIDLNTSSPPRDEQEHPLASLTSEGPLILRIGSTALFALTTGDPTDWPDRALDAWSCLPPRIVVDERPAIVPPRAEPPCQARERMDATIVTRCRPAAPLPESDLPAEVAGTLTLRTPHSDRAFRIGRDQLGRGVLVGCYDRCNATGAFLDGLGVSRVHALLLEIQGSPYLLDTASTAGLGEPGTAQPSIDLNTAMWTVLGDTSVAIGWKST